MPELPEVEVLKKTLEPRLIGRVIRRIDVVERRLREPVNAARLRRDCLERRIVGLRRRAKYLLIDFRGGTTLVVHLGMSGRLTLAPQRSAPEPHEHLSFALSGGARLRFRDPRRFGLVFSANTKRLANDKHFRLLGSEPLAPDFSGDLLADLAESRTAPVKSFLMDGRNVVGIGNIYACEALHRSGIHPFRKAGRISAKRWDVLAAAIREVLGDAIEQGGTTLNDFADGEGNSGYFQIDLAVYGREGQPCWRCGRSIRRRVLSNRSTFYCPGCQR